MLHECPLYFYANIHNLFFLSEQDQGKESSDETAILKLSVQSSDSDNEEMGMPSQR